MLGGIQGGRTASYDEALAIPSEEAVTLAVRTNQIIAHETGIADVVDPLGGSYYLEWLTKKMEDGIGDYIAKIDAMGGALGAVERGFYAQELSDGAYRQHRAVERGETVIVGVNKYRTDEEPDMPIFRPNPESERRQIAGLGDLRRNRDQAAADRALERLRAVSVSGENVVPSPRPSRPTPPSARSATSAVFGEFVDHPVQVEGRSVKQRRHERALGMSTGLSREGHMATPRIGFLGGCGARRDFAQRVCRDRYDVDASFRSGRRRRA